MSNQTTTEVTRQPGIAAKIAMVFAVGTMAGGGIMYSLAQRPREAQATTVPQVAPAAPVAAQPVQQPLVVQIITPPLPEGTRIEVRNGGAESAPVATAAIAGNQDVSGAENGPLFGPPLPPGFAAKEETKSVQDDNEKGTVVSIPVPAAPAPPTPQPPQAAAPVKVPTLPPPAASTAFSGTPTVDNKVNINTASQAELELLPQVGPAMAKKIMEYREKNGPFKDPKELDRIKGIGPKTLEKLLPLVTVKPDKPAR